MMLSLALACNGSGGGPVNSKAREFMDLYYTRADLQGAKSIAAGLAAEKIQQELDLGGGHAPTDAKANRVVKYSRQERSAGEGDSETRAERYYALEINADRMTVKRLVRLTLESQAGQWKVVNIAESPA